MLKIELDRESRILKLHPNGPLCEDDFKRAASLVDPLIEAGNDLAGIIIQAEKFPGWNSFASLITHIRFVHDHHHHVRRLAIVSDAVALNLLPMIGAHFVAAEVRHFDAGQADIALRWIKS